MGTSDSVNEALVKMTQDEYFAASEGREVVTPENIGGLCDYPALFNAMVKNRDLRPALSPAMGTGRAMNDFLTCTPEEFSDKYIVAAGPTNPKTGKPYGSDTKAYQEWRAQQPKEPVTPEEFNMFGDMAKAYNSHNAIVSLKDYRCIQNAVFKADICGVGCLVKVDKLYVREADVVAVDIKTTADLPAFSRTAASLFYREQQALISMVLEKNGINAFSEIAAIEKGPIPRCGIFFVEAAKKLACEKAVYDMLHDYADSLASGVFRTGFEREAFSL